MPEHAKRATRAPHPPELKIGPFQGGIGVAVWLNRIRRTKAPRRSGPLLSPRVVTATARPASGRTPGRTVPRT